MIKTEFNPPTPVEIDFTKAVAKGKPISLKNFTSYTFDRNILIPAAAFRFTAPSVDKTERLQVRSGDVASVWVPCPDNVKRQIATGIVDETDTHITPTNVEYLLTGRDMIGQMIDNAAVDSANNIINAENISLGKLVTFLIKGTRMPQEFVKTDDVPNLKLLFNTNPGETKINALQRYLEFTNCLVWTLPNGQLKIGKPNFTRNTDGVLILSASDSSNNNMMEARVRRNLNQAIRQIVSQLQSGGNINPTPFTKHNNDKDMKSVASANVGRSVYETFSYGSGMDAANTVTQVGNQSGNPRQIGDEYSLRKMAMDNMKVLDVEAVVRNHYNENFQPYDVDQIYSVQIEDEDLFEDMYVYSCSYELTLEHGMVTRMKLCRIGTICAYAAAIQRGIK
jgi:prophage tail gpP-like protein